MAANIQLRFSGGVANTDPDASLGGAMSTETAAIISTANTNLNNLFDNISKTENLAGTVDYRCVYIQNTGDALNGVELYLTGNNATNAWVSLGVIEGSDEEAGIVGYSAQSILDEETDPVYTRVVTNTGDDSTDTYAITGAEGAGLFTIVSVKVDGTPYSVNSPPSAPGEYEISGTNIVVYANGTGGFLNTGEVLVVEYYNDTADITETVYTSASPLVTGIDLGTNEEFPIWIKREAALAVGSGSVTDVISLVVRGVEA